MWQPADPRSAELAGLRAELTGAEGTIHTVKLRLETSGPQRIEAVRLGASNLPPCAPSEPLALRDASSGEPIELPQELDGPAAVTVQLPWRQVRGSGLTVDVEASVDGGQPRCLRLPLTAADRVLWRTHEPVWRMGASARWDFPKGGAPAGVGQGPMFELRWLRELGALSPVFGLSFGAAGCRHDCPDTDLAPSSDDGDLTLVGTFAVVGLSLGVEHRLELGRWGLELGAGGSATVAALQVPEGWSGPRAAALLGPYATVRLTFPDTHALTGFSPRVNGMLHGVEVIVRRTTGFGRGSRDSAWMFSLGWSFEGTL
jgi:hypothetical protein